MGISLDGKTWQRRRDDCWVFGVEVRGVVRDPYAEVTLDDSIRDRTAEAAGGCWAWKLFGDKSDRAGHEFSFTRAIMAAEEALAVAPPDKRLKENR